MHSAIHALVVDDQNLVRLSMRQILKDYPNISTITEASSGEEAIELAKKNKFDLALVDLKMPGINGIETCEALIKLYPDIKMLIVTACVDELLVPQIFNAGISGYFSKSSGSAELIKAIKTVQTGQRYISETLPRPVSVSESAQSELSLFDTLSERELQVVLMLIEGKNIQKIAEKLRVNTKTVNSYRARSFQKLNIDNDVELTLLATRRGLIKNQKEEVK